jgi:hypothetical protein
MHRVKLEAEKSNMDVIYTGTNRYVGSQHLLQTTEDGFIDGNEGAKRFPIWHSTMDVDTDILLLRPRHHSSMGLFRGVGSVAVHRKKRKGTEHSGNEE